MATKLKTALVLAGGFGTRLRSVVSDVPKPMAPVAGRPYLEYLFDYWIDQGIERFVVSIGYLGDVIRNHFGNTYRDTSVEYIQEQTPLGTGGALKLALQTLAWAEPQFVLINGDTWFEADLNLLVHDAATHNTPVTIALKKVAANDRYGGVLVNGKGLITAFGVKQSGEMLINAGCYLIEVNRLFDALQHYPAQFSFETDCLSALAPSGQIAASIQDCRFLDIGVPEDYARAAEYIVR